MRSRISVSRAIVAALMLTAFSVCYASENEDSSMYYLELSSIGFPAAEKQADAWKINELKVFDGRLYVGYGDAVVNTGPTDVIYFDLKTKEFVTEFTVDDEAIFKYQVVDGKLVIPGVDATENWEFGNVYVLTADGWVKRRSVTNGLHVNDIVSFDGRWYASTGSYFEFGKDKAFFAFGAILRSEDAGETWRLVYSTPCDESNVFRVNSLVPYGGKLYAFVYSYTGMGTEEIPEEYRPYMGDLNADSHLILGNDLFGVQDAIVYDGKRWQYADLVDKPDVCYTSPFVFKDKLVMSVVSGQYVDYIGYLTQTRKGGLETISLCAFDGKRTEELPLEYQFLRDVVVKEDRLLLLIVRDKRYFVVETPDLVTWKYYVFPESVNRPKSLEHDGGSFYIGMEDGNIFKSTDTVEIDDVSQIKGREPMKIWGGGQLPRDGKWYWAAITGWADWGKTARISCEIKHGNIIDVTTSNISAFNVFVPLAEIDKAKALVLNIDGREFFRDKLDGYTELVCKYTEKKKWEVEKGRGTAETFEYSKKVIGEAEVDLTRSGDDPPIGRWKADVVKWAASADAAVITKSGIRGDLSKGDVTLEEVFGLNYRNSICTFKTNGKTLRRMMDFNVKLPEREQCQMSGFSLTYEAGEEAKENKVIECSLDPEKEYLVATSDYVAERAKRFFGEEVEHEDIGFQLNEAMIRWFEKYRKIGEIEPRIKVIRQK